MVETLLLIAVEVMAHSKLTDSDALTEKLLIILSSLGFCEASSLHVTLNTLRIASLRISPSSYNVWLFTCAWMYCIAFCGLVLYRRRKALRLVDKSVSFFSNFSISSSMSPIISEPKCTYTWYRQTTAFLLT